MIYIKIALIVLMASGCANIAGALKSASEYHEPESQPRTQSVNCFTTYAEFSSFTTCN